MFSSYHAIQFNQATGNRITPDNMEPIDELETRIRDSYKIVTEYEIIRQDTGNPKERHRCEREISGQWEIIKGYLDEYFSICNSLNKSVSNDIRQIAAHFPQFLANDFQQAYATLQSTVPDSTEALGQLTRVLKELGRFHEHLNEWKEMHNLLQDCITAFMPLKSELEVTIENPDIWRKARGRRLWGSCRTQLRRLESFAEGIQYIDIAFFQDEKSIKGPDWMIKILFSRNEFEICVKEGDPEIMYEALDELWHDCYDALYFADKQLRDMVGKLYSFSNTMLRSVENDD